MGSAPRPAGVSGSGLCQPSETAYLLLPEKLTATQEGQRAPGRCGLQAPEMLGGHRQNEQNVFCNNERDGGWKVLAGVAVGTGCLGTWVRGRKSEGWAEG